MMSIFIDLYKSIAFFFKKENAEVKEIKILRSIWTRKASLSIQTFILMCFLLKIYYPGYVYVFEILRGITISFCVYLIIQLYLFYGIEKGIKKHLFERGSDNELILSLIDISKTTVLTGAILINVLSVMMTRLTLVSFVVNHLMYVISASFLTKISDIASDIKAKLTNKFANEDEDSSDISYIDNLGDIVGECSILLINSVLVIVLMCNVLKITSDIVSKVRMIVGILYVSLWFGKKICQRFYLSESRKILNPRDLIRISLIIFQILCASLYVKVTTLNTMALVKIIGLTISPIIITYVIVGPSYKRFYPIFTKLGAVFSFFLLFVYTANYTRITFRIYELLMTYAGDVAYLDVLFKCIMIFFIPLLFLATLGAIADSTEGLMIKRINEQSKFGNLIEQNTLNLPLSTDDKRDLLETLDKMDTSGNKFKILMKSYNIFILIYIALRTMSIGMPISSLWISGLLPVFVTSFCFHLYKILNKKDLNAEKVISECYDRNLALNIPVAIAIIMTSVTPYYRTVSFAGNLIRILTVAGLSNVLGGLFDVIKKDTEEYKNDYEYAEIVKMDLIGDMFKDVISPIMTACAILIISLYVSV